jgi:peptide/nickel transport system permease protein
MARFLIRRLVYLVLLVIVSTSAAYLLAATQLNPRARYENRTPPPSPEVVDSVLSAINMNDKSPLTHRLGRWASGVLRGDLGRTIDNQPVNDEIVRRMFVSLRLLLLGAILGIISGVGLGAYAAIRQYSTFDHLLTAGSFIILSIPIVVLAVLLKNGGTELNSLLGFTGETKLLYTTGEITPGLDPWTWKGIVDRIGHLILPTMVLTLAGMAFYGRYQRNAMLDVLGSDFLRTAQAKGLRRPRALIKHGLRTALIPMATFFSYQFALLFVGATFTEKIFGWHGMGEYFVDAVTGSDVNSVAGVTLIVAIFVLLAGFISDVVYAALDPRVRV